VIELQQFLNFNLARKKMARKNCAKSTILVDGSEHTTRAEGIEEKRLNPRQATCRSNSLANFQRSHFSTTKKHIILQVFNLAPNSLGVFMGGRECYVAALIKCSNRDIVKKSSSRKQRVLVLLPGLMNIKKSAGRIGVIKQLNTPNPVLYITFPEVCTFTETTFSLFSLTHKQAMVTLWFFGSSKLDFFFVLFVFFCFFFFWRKFNITIGTIEDAWHGSQVRSQFPHYETSRQNWRHFARRRVRVGVGVLRMHLDRSRRNK
jgi:hypothetical protein